MNDLALLNPEIFKFPEDIQQVIIERIKKGDSYFFLMTKEEIEKELEEEEKQKIKSKKINNLITLEVLFDTQVSTLLKKEFPKHAGMNEKEFLSHILPLKESLKEIEYIEFQEGHISFIIVIKNEMISAEKMMPLVELEGKKGNTNMSADEIKNFKPIKEVNIPKALAYLTVDIETGKTSLGKTTNAAIIQIKSENRSPLTLEEGVSLFIHHSEIFKENNIWLSGSRYYDNDKVAYLWFSEGRPKPAWVWTGGFWTGGYSNSKWGSASCLRRL